MTFDKETVWLSKAQIAELFQRDRSVISRHIKNVFEEGELPYESNVQNLHVAHSDKPVECFDLAEINALEHKLNLLLNIRSNKSLSPDFESSA